jgi:peptide/nickel transport system substrate-binding protein
VVADDVVFSISRIIDPATASPGRSALGPLQKVAAVDHSTVKFTLTSPYSGFPTALSDRWGRIVPRDKRHQLKTQAFGSGPFKIKKYIPGVSATLVRNEGHWESGVPSLDQVTLRTFPDPVSEIAALSSGETQIMYSVAPSNYAQVAGISGVKAYEIPTGSWLPMVMGVDTPPFDQLAVRQAIKYCIDRQAFVQIVLQGHGTPANDHNIPPSSPFYRNVPLRKQDYGQAKHLLAQAGLPNGFSHDLYAATDTPLRASTAQTIQQMVAPAGIKLNVKTVAYDTYIARIYKKAPLYIGNWAMRPVLDAQLSPFFSTNGSFNEYRYSNPHLDALLAQARSARTAAKQKPLYQQVQRILTDDGPALIPYLENFIEAASTHIKGFKPHPMSWLDVRYLSYE